MRRMTPAEVVAEMQRDTIVNRIRQALTNHCATMEQAASNRRPPGIIEYRNMEFEAARDILRLVREWDTQLAEQERLSAATGMSANQ